MYDAAKLLITHIQNDTINISKQLFYHISEHLCMYSHNLFSNYSEKTGICIFLNMAIIENSFQNIL